jgi:hypothetical protein
VPGFDSGQGEHDVQTGFVEYRGQTGMGGAFPPVPVSLRGGYLVRERCRPVLPLAERAVTCLRAQNAAADCKRPEECVMERRTVAKFRRASGDCKSASCPALIALIDRRGKHTALLWLEQRPSRCSGVPAFSVRGQVHKQPLFEYDTRIVGGDAQQSLVVVVQGPVKAHH